jgi:hypothetical protein
MSSAVKMIVTLVSLLVITSGVLQLLDVAPSKIESVRVSLGAFFLVVWVGYLVLYVIAPGLRRKLLRLKNRMRYRIHSFLHPGGIHLGTTVLGLSAYQREIEDHVKSSRRIYLLLVSGQTMFFDPKEQFLHGALENLTLQALSQKDIRFRLADPNGETFRQRAAWLVDEMKRRMEPWAVRDVQEYTTRCGTIAARLRQISDDVQYYKREPLWRLLIFDESMYVSTYRDPSGERHQGQLTWVSQIPAESAIYVGLLAHFLRVGAARAAIVVAANQQDVFRSLVNAFASTDTVEVLHDRRRGERRRLKEAAPTERRRSERRSANGANELVSRGWTVAQLVSQ